MNEDLAKSLEQLEAKKKRINAECDLTRECNSIVELDRRLGRLLDEFKTLRTSVDDQMSTTQDAYDKLASVNLELRRTSQMFEVSSQLLQLSRICRRIDNIEAFASPHNYLRSLERRLSSAGETVAENEPNEGGEHSCRTAVMLDIIKTFESLYQPLESALTKRINLPYTSYAERVRTLKKLLETLCVNDLGENASNVTSNVT